MQLLSGVFSTGDTILVDVDAEDEHKLKFSRQTEPAAETQPPLIVVAETEAES
jgi:hypothetical protein